MSDCSPASIRKFFLILARLVDYRVKYCSAVLYIAFIVLAGRNLVNTLCTDNSSEWRGYLGIIGCQGSYTPKWARKSKIVCSQSLIRLQSKLELLHWNHRTRMWASSAKFCCTWSRPTSSGYGSSYFLKVRGQFHMTQLRPLCEVTRFRHSTISLEGRSS